MEQPTPAPAHQPYTVADYLSSERVAAEKHEYCDGTIIAMAGASTSHVRIAGNLGRRIAERLDGSACEVFGSDQWVRADRTRYCYPDLTVACQPLTYDPLGDDPESILTNPRLLIEILSPSTELADRGEKFTRYRNLASLDEYLLVAQDRPRVEPFYRRADGDWTIGKSVHGLDAVLHVRCLDIDLPLAHIYARVTFPPTPSPVDVG